MYKDGCKGCDLSQRHGKPRGGVVVRLAGQWLLNHYGDREGYLGWVALQPRQHKMELDELTAEEANALGRNIKRIHNALRDYWKAHFPSDRIERVYIVYFFESYWDDPKNCKYHLHIHLIPRTRKMVGNGRPSKWAAWFTPYLVYQDWFPPQYQIWDKSRKKHENEKEVVKLMKYLKSHLGK